MLIGKFRVVQPRKYSPNSRCHPSSCLPAVLVMFLANSSPISRSLLVAGLIYINIAFFPDRLKNGTNFPKQLLKLPTQRPSSLPWGPRPGPIEHLNFFYFYITSTNSLHCFLAHIARAQHISAEDGLYCPLQIRHLDLDKSCNLLSGTQELKSSLYPFQDTRACFFL